MEDTFDKLFREYLQTERGRRAVKEIVDREIRTTTKTPEVVISMDTLQAYCQQLGMLGLEIELAEEIQARGKAKVV